jgi:hypothetical protein
MRVPAPLMDTCPRPCPLIHGPRMLNARPRMETR